MINPLPKALLAAVTSLALFTTIHAAENAATGIKDGLKLIVTMVESPDSRQLSFECILHNTTDQDIPFDRTGNHFRLSFQLLDAAGHEIPIDTKWKIANAPSDREMVFSRHSSSAVRPGTDRVFVLRLEEAYGERWKQAVSLVVNWEPGTDWSTERPYTKGRGLTVTCPIPKEETSDLKETKPVPQVPPAAPDAYTAPMTLEVQSSSSVPWTVIAVLAVIAALVLRQVIKKGA